MSSIRALRSLGGRPAPITPVSEEEKATYREKPVLKPRPKLPEKPSSNQPRKPRTQNPLEAPSKVIKKAVNEYQWATKAAGNALGNVFRQAAGKEPVTVEQAEKAEKKRRATGQTKLPDKINTITKPVSDLKRMVTGAPVRAVEGAVGTAMFVGDLINVGADRMLGVKTDPSLNPFHIKYIEPELNTGIAVPSTSAGKLGQGILSLVGTAAAVTTKLPAATTKAGAFLRGEAGGVAADLLLTKKGDGNLTALLRDSLPEEWRDSVLFFLASDKDDTAISARLKNALEGVGLGALLGGLGALRAARNTPLEPEAIRALPGGDRIVGLWPPGKPTLQEELQIRAEIYNSYLDYDAASNLTNATREAQRFDEINLRLLDELEAKQLEIDLGSVPGSGRMEIDPGGPRQEQLTLEGTASVRDPDVDLDAKAEVQTEGSVELAGPKPTEETPSAAAPQAAPASAAAAAPVAPDPDEALIRQYLDNPDSITDLTEQKRIAEKLKGQLVKRTPEEQKVYDKKQQTARRKKDLEKIQRYLEDPRSIVDTTERARIQKLVKDLYSQRAQTEATSAAAPAKAAQTPTARPTEASKAPETGKPPGEGQKAPADASKVDPQAVQVGVQSRVDLGYSPQDFSLLPQERAATFTPTAPDVALKATYPTNVLTDAQVKSFRWDDKLAEGFRTFEKDPRIQQILSNPRLADRRVITEAFDSMNRIREAAGESDFYRVPDAAKSFEEQGLIQTVRRPDGSETKVFNESGVVAARVFFRDIGNHAWQTAKTMADLAEEGKPFGNLPDKMLDDLIAMLNIGKRTQQLGGRLTRAWGLPINPQTGTMSLSKEVDGLSGFDEAISKVQEIQDAVTAGREDLVRDDLNILGAMLRASEGKPEKIMSFWKLARTVGFKDMGTNMIQSLFSGPRTQLVSIVGNSYAAVERPLSAMIKGAVTFDKDAVNMGIAGLRATVQAIPEAFQMGFAAVKNGPGGYRYTDASKYIQSEARTVESIEELVARARTPEQKAAASFIKLQHRFITANPIFDYGPRLLSAGDDAFQHIAMRQWAAMESMYKASSSTTNTREAYNSYLKEFYDTKISPDGHIIDPELKEWIAQATFQGEVQRPVQALSDFLNQVPILKWFIPVVNTPAEVLRYVGKHTLLVNRLVTDHAEVLARAKGGDVAAQAKLAVYEGRLGMGAMIATLGGMYALTGNVTGFGPPIGSRQWQVWQNLGKRPLSIKIGDKWFDYSTVEPMTTIMGTVADAAMLIKMGATDAAHQLLVQAAFTFSAAILDKTVLTGIQDLAKVLDVRTSVDARQTAMASLINNTLPASSLRRALYNTFNPLKTEFQYTSQRLLAQATVGLINKGSVYIDPLTGESELSYAGGFYNANSPIRVVDENMDPLKWQLEKDGFGYRNNKRGLNQVELSPEQQQQVHKIMYEIGIRDVLTEAVTNPNYRALADSWDRRPHDPDQPSTAPPHLDHLNRQWNRVRQEAIRVLMDRDPSFAEAMIQGAEKRRAYKQAEFENQGEAAPTVLNKLLSMPK